MGAPRPQDWSCAVLTARRAHNPGNPGFESCLCHVLAVCLCPSLGSSFLIQRGNNDNPPVSSLGISVLSYVMCSSITCPPRGQASPGASGTALGPGPEDIGHRGELGARDLLSPPGPHSTLGARPSAESPCCPRVPCRESPPAGQKTPDSGHVSQEPRSENSSTQSSPEMPTTKNRLGLGAHPPLILSSPCPDLGLPRGIDSTTLGCQGELGTFSDHPLTHTHLQVPCKALE